MHEIPADLAKSLRSYRGSVHSKSPAPEDRARSPISDIASDRDDDRNPSSLILHPTASRRHLRHTGELHKETYPPVPRNVVAPPPPVSVPNTDPPKANPDKPFAVDGTADPDPVAAREKDSPEPLTEPNFYELMGMRPPMETGQHPKRLGAVNGLYTTIHSHYEYVHRKYMVYDVIIYLFLILQIILAAVFIVLGALRNIDSHTAVATLGAVSTVIGGILALMKGQGLPNRLRMTRAGLRKVIFEAEELYWDVGAGRTVFYSDIKKVREDYMRVLQEATLNHPDTWNTATSNMAQGMHSSAGKVPQPADVKPPAQPAAKAG